MDIAENNPEPMTGTYPELRKYVPKDIRCKMKKFRSKLHSQGRKRLQKKSWSFSKINVEWKYMSRASRSLRRRGIYQRKVLQPADRSRDWFWKDGKRPLDLQAPRLWPLPVWEEKPKPPYHHINFLGSPTYTKSFTPAEVSLWFVKISSTKPKFDPLSRKGVITSQATKLIDPFDYFGPDDALKSLSDNKLINAVTGQVRKVYENHGTWLEDNSYGDEKDAPINEETTGIFPVKRNTCAFRLQKPYLMRPMDGDFIFNGDHKPLLCLPKKRELGDVRMPTTYTPSKLRTVQSSNYYGELGRMIWGVLSKYVKHVLKIPDFTSGDRQQNFQPTPPWRIKSVFFFCFAFALSALLYVMYGNNK